MAQELRLPSEKLRWLISILSEWEGRRSATKHQLQCLIGHLSHASKVVKPGRSFMRELIRTMAILKASFHLVRLNTQCRADIMWWSTFLSDWNGISLFPGMPLGSNCHVRCIRIMGLWCLPSPSCTMVPTTVAQSIG